jgi:hypothetical protein
MAEIGEPMNSKIRVEIQSLIESNTVRSGGDFHTDILDDNGLIYDLTKKFKLTPRESGQSVDDALEEVIKKSTKKVRGMIDSKEMKSNIFLKRLHETFEIGKI